MNLRFLAYFGLLLATALCEGRAQAAPGDATRLDYARSDLAASCPDREALQSAVVKRLGYDPFFPVARQTIVVQILDSEAGLRAEMHLVDANGIIRGSRELGESRGHCDELVAALALAISIALDPSAALGIETRPGAQDAAEPPANSENDAQPVVARPEREPPPAESAPTRAGKRHAPPPPGQPQGAAHPTLIGLRAAGLVAISVAPATAFGWKAGLSLREHWLELIAEFVDQLPASHDLAGGSARASLLASNLAACFSEARFAGCALSTVGSFQSQGESISTPHRQSSLYVALGARFEYEPELVGPLHLLLQADASRNVTPLTLRLAGKDVWKTPALSLVAGAGLELIFP